MCLFAVFSSLAILHVVHVVCPVSLSVSGAVFFLLSFQTQCRLILCQDTVMALQAISEYAVNFPRGVANSNVVVTPLDLTTARPQSLNIDSANAALLQTMEVGHTHRDRNTNTQTHTQTYTHKCT